MMEYVIVLVFIGAALAMTSSRLFYSSIPGAQDDQGLGSDPRIAPPGFGAMGVKMVGFYQRTMGGLSLPIP